MPAIDVSAQRAALLTHQELLAQLPPDLLEIIRDGCTPASFLDAIATAALIPRFTGIIFTHFESEISEICAKWLMRPRDQGQEDIIIAAFARILPFAPYLSVFLERYISETSYRFGSELHTFGINSLNTRPTENFVIEELQRTLLTLWRLLNFDKKSFSRLVPPSRIQDLFRHGNASVRYLAIRVFCCQLSASDFNLEGLIRQHIKHEESLVGDFDGVQVDYTFLSLVERQRAEEWDKSRQKIRAELENYNGEQFHPQALEDIVIQYNSTILPRPNGPSSIVSRLVQTPTTLTNLQGLAQNLQKPGPILLHGLPGSGKTSIVHELARELKMEESMVTLHLNEQTDAKMLIGLYSTGSKPGSFSWRPGVLTTAVREGRWVLIEDLDRAPNEVMSTLLPLVEHGKLLIPSRGETVEAPSSFRLFATVRTTRGVNGQENLPSILGQRFWNLSSVKMPPPVELESIIVGSYHLLYKYIPMIMSVYRRLCHLSSLPHVSNSGRSIVERSVTPRDVLKWCRRLNETLIASGCKLGDEPISETTRDWMFMDAVDCFCGNLSKPEARAALVSCIAEEMHLSQQLTEHYLKVHVPQMEESPSSFKVGRVMLTRRKHANRVVKSRKPFASTSHSRRLLEQISMAVKLREPVLLVGETGIGKTTVIQQLAESLGHKLVAVNLSQQSEVGDLLGGFKPVNARSLAVPLKEEFEDLFASTGISASKNQKYLEQIGKCAAKGQWTKVSKLWREAPAMFNKIVSQLQAQAMASNDGESDGQPVVKRRKVESRLQSLLDLKPRWEAFSRSLQQFDVQISGGSGSFAFSFVEGNIVKAARNGDWVLLDEINLASPDTLESIADLLASGPNNEPSILLSETGDIERVKAHSDFRIFGAMNPATDVGKRDLPPGLRSRFTEFYVGSPDKDLKDLLTIIKAYLSGKSVKDDQAADDIARLYLNTKSRAEEKRLVDGANEVPHFSLRTLTRVLSYVNDVAPFYGLRRALYEGFSMGFLTLLDRASEETLVPLIHHHLLDKYGGARSLLSQSPKYPDDGKQYVKFVNRNKDRQYWLLRGEETPIERTDYIITPYIERNLLNLVRATSTRRFPILIQGPTSAGKTSMIEYLANFSGNKFVRINNHEHTDLQEYLGTYVSDANGKLLFQEGLLVQALRQGHWIVLDELNLAPTDVLEALNRLLDDNRELLIPETQEVVRPHENFMLFATQNPPGLYGGRKVLSRAFRNRFLELHFDDIPEDELEIILQKRSLYTAPSDCKRIVNVYKELSRLRQTSRLFENKDSFATLRDLFRWALRGAETREEIAANGFMLLAERVRNEEERMAVKKVIETVFKVKIDQEQLYDIQKSPYLRVQPPNNGQGVVWTHAMRRLYVLVASALRHNEPVLLVGETGCGKTTVCQLLAESLGKELHIVNAHQNTETGDLIGSQRPIRNRGAVLDVLTQDLSAVLEGLGEMVDDNSIEVLLEKYHALDKSVLARVPADLQRRISENEVKSKALFEWADGSLVHAMRDGQFFLLDEISLADDSVLERLNSVLEPQRTLLLAEKGIDDSFIRASDGFQFLATMNPGGDFGKKELSPALRNRFTEIWVSPLSADEDVLHIVSSKLRPEFQQAAKVIVEFSYWFGQNFRSTASTAFSIRDILVWVKFVNESATLSTAASVVHGAATVFIDTLGANPSALIAIDPKSMDSQRQKCLDKLSQLLGCDAAAIYRAHLELTVKPNELRIGDFSIKRIANESFEVGFALHAPTTKLNAMRVIRALQVQKPILLEGSPGVGKTTLVSALAKACGRPLTRINLSDQTDLMDLFGTDVPVEGAEAGHFAWRDAPFLRAMQNGEWVLLDEMNLASQSVLEGLNACLDHRGEVYVSELDQVFKKHPDFRLFAAQNPHHQGGGRKGLPSSFVNRFIVVYADVFSEEDLLLIAEHNFPTVPQKTVQRMINFISNLETRILVEKAFGSQGSPWEFNLRDTLRWLHLLTSSDPLLRTGKVDDFLNIAIKQRFRTERDRLEVEKLFAETFGVPPKGHQLYHNMNSSLLQVGLALAKRNKLLQPSQFPSMDVVPRLMEIESLLICINQNIPCILVGPSGSGKSMLLQHVAASCGKSLITFPMNADIDAMDLVGGFEQSDPMRDINAALRELREALRISTASTLVQGVYGSAVDLLNVLGSMTSQAGVSQSLLDAIENLLSQIPEDSDLAVTLSNVLEILRRSISISNPKFEWLDGIIVQALQKGDWLVLDNANLCSASVLDRLNSLLEPGGYLIINEHCGPNGEPRIIKPHPDFRIFLTVDPRYGELSRAMRNRAIEIYIEPHNSVAPPWRSHVTEVESSLKRYELLSAALYFDTENKSSIFDVAIDSLSFEDLPMLEKYTPFAWQPQAMPILRKNDIVKYRFRGAQLDFDGTKQTIGAFLHSEFMADILTKIREHYYAPLAKTITAGFEDMQPLYPIQNSAIVPCLQEESSRHQLPFSLAAAYDRFMDMAEAMKRLSLEDPTGKGFRVSELNRLQRSCIANTVAAASKDSTVGAYSFLNHMLNTLYSFIQANMFNPNSGRERAYFCRDLMNQWWIAFRLLTAPRFAEADFHAYLSLFSDMLSDRISRPVHDGTNQIAQTVLNLLNSCFVSGFTLSTGLSMEILWEGLRPIPIKNESLLDNIRRMERLAAQFDSVKWKSTTTLPDLSNIMGSFVKVYQLIRIGQPKVEELLETLTTEIDQLVNKLGDNSSVTSPYMTAEFETTRQIILLDSMSSRKDLPQSSGEVILLSSLPLVTQMRTTSASTTSKILLLMESFASDSSEKQAWDDVLSARILSKLETIDSTGLGSLASLEAELPILAKQLCTDAEALTADRIRKLSEVFYHLMMDVLAIYNPSLASEFTSILNTPKTQVVSDFVQISEQGDKLVFNLDQLMPNVMRENYSKIDKCHLAPSLAFLIASRNGSRHTRRSNLANAWVQFSVALIKLFVPDKAYDPQLKSVLGLQGYEYRLEVLKHELELIRQFEKFQTGQSTNLRCEYLEEEIVAVGPPPTSVQAVYRPVDHQLANIQTEFNNLLKIILKSDLSMLVLQNCSGEAAAAQQLDVIRENISRIGDRLKHDKYRAYEDIVSPVINMIHCLEIGLYLGREAGPEVANDNHPSKALLELAPFLGGRPNTSVIQPTPSQSLEFLSYSRMVIAVEGPGGLDRISQGTFQAIHSLYDQWARKLEADKKAEESKKSWYRYRGGLDEEEAAEQEAFDELFPSFNEDDEVERREIPKIGDARALAIRLSRLHKDIFLAPQDATESIISLNRDFAQKVSANMEFSITDRNLLSVVLLSLDEKLREIKSNACPAEYNFYTDRNLPEARKLVNLVHEIRARFQQLRQVDEIGHLQPLIDVVASCDKILQLGHSDPLASTIPKVEQLHAFVYEWQFGGWASKTYGVLPLYNRLTDLLVGWRRLELSTWGKLFDMEVRKSEEDATSWWFIAYQAIVAAPLTLAQAGEDLSQHISGLLKELETYFSSAPVGQFASRLGLLKQLHKQVELVTADYPSMSIIQDGLHNFISFYSRYMKAVDNQIRTGRNPLEKQMKDVLLLASWKDTNIVALRESARKSHHKLFRIVKKFREVLGQPMKPIIEAGLPDEVLDEAATTEIKTEIMPIDKSAIKLCSEHIPNWSDNYRRLANIQRTTDIMGRLSRIPESALDAGEAINSFLSNLEESAAELRKETPGILTEENKALVKHLKSRKRKLFAETLKEARQMGIQYNLSTDILSQQDALSTVLATSDTLASQASEEFKSTEYYFHKMLDLAPRVRRAYNEHSEDLTTAEVDRSIGYLEGILHVAIKQRRGLAKVLKHHGALTSSLKYIGSVSNLRGGDKVKAASLSADHKKACAWIVQIIKVGRQLIELHAKFGNLDHRELLGCLDGRLAEFAELSSRWNSLPTLPNGLTSLERSRLESQISSSLGEFRYELDGWCRRWPALAFLLEQIQLWSTVDGQSIATPVLDAKRRQIDTILDASKNLCDSILVTIEQLKKTMIKLPASQEEAGWLTRYGEVMTDSLKVLRIDKVERSIMELLTLFAQVDLNDRLVNQISTSLMAVIAPIVDQYQVACNQTIGSFARVHRNTCKLGYKLSKNFTQLASQGFCTPQEKSDEKSGETGELESGTGLGEGEGAEDISKDIQPDEDLSELAQEGNQESKQEMEDEKDAVDMADQELQGDMESVDGGDDEEKGSNSGEEDESGDEMDEEAGEVDDLDPSAVDEKMWDGENEDDAEKDQQGENTKGQKKKDEQVAAEAQPDTQEIEEGEDGSQGDENPDENAAAEENEGVQQQDEANMQDQNVQEQDALALPDDMNIDGDDNDSLSSLSDDELDKLSDVDQEEQKDKQMSDHESETNEDVDMEMASPDAGNDNEEMDENADQDEEAKIQEDEQAEEPEQQTEDQEMAQLPSNDEANAAKEDAAPSDVKGGGQDLDPNQIEEAQNDQSNAAQREDGEMGENAADQDASAGKKGSVSKTQEQPQQTEFEDTKDSSNHQPFKALGDALEKWHRQREEIKEAQEQESQEQSTTAEPESVIKEFQHIQNDESAADTQAMGTSNEEQRQQIDESMAIDDDDEEAADSRVIPEDEIEVDDADTDKMDTSEPQDYQDKQDAQKEEKPSGVSTHQGAYNRDTTPPTNGEEPLEEIKEEIEETSERLSITHLSEPSLDLRDFDETMQQWTSFQSKTHPLSLSLTSQLRLILTPSQSTKLSGSYRTGKRLNIKRIIPYIASSYKRDKIWMRRAIPTKRSYQILLCVDDSKSMGESSSGELALESLVMVSRALTMLEVGQIGVMGFGANTFMAHEFTEPFASHDAGAKVLQKFTFQQDYTNIELLIKQTIERFRLARLQSTARGSEDLWQLALILSDGLTPSAAHEHIRVLLREAMEERIMIVFIIMDDTTGGNAKDKDKQSVVNLKKVRFMGNDEIKTEYYLDTFPFQYYLIVHNLEDLPGALAGLLRTWFAEVNS
ncbi:midasin [Daldinia sp. FL1419]|nr:midasin [Daldinia sp. FL1419]